MRDLSLEIQPMRALPLSACLLVWAVTLHGQTTSHRESPALAWGPAPAVFPAGAMMAVVSGDPSKAGQFVVELSFPDGYRISPHFHPTEEIAEVKKGTFLVGMGDTLDVAKTNTMKVGDKGKIPALAHHYAVAKGATVVEITSTGPFAMIYVNPLDNPQEAASK
jgi:quercetin dioxygenase-like cupin family protein